VVLIVCVGVSQLIECEASSYQRLVEVGLPQRQWAYGGDGCRGDREMDGG